MTRQTFTVTIEYNTKDGCGNTIPQYTEGDIRRAMAKGLECYSSIVVEEMAGKEHKSRPSPQHP